MQRASLAVHDLRLVSVSASRGPTSLSSLPRSAVFHFHRPAAFRQHRQQARSFSLWPASSSTAAEVATEASQAVLEDTFFTPLSDALLSLSSNYAALIPLYTIAFRLFTTLPVTLWQRRRTRKFVDDLVPIIKLQQATTERKVREECKARRAPFEEYQKEFKKRAAEDAKRISKAHGVHPTLTFLLPPLVHIPLFIGTTMVLRDLCERATSSLALDPNTYASLQAFATTPFLWCPSLSLTDPTLILPLLVGLATISNVEVSSVNRKRLQHLLQGPMPAPPAPSGPVNRATAAAAARRRRMFSTTHAAHAPQAPLSRFEQAEKQKYMSEVRDKLVTNILRVSGVLFVPVAMFAPAAVCSYWITSNIFTLVQNLIFARIDSKRALKKQVMNPRLREER